MKELSTEEKAKRYDEAIERMKSWARGEHPECFTEAQKAAEFIFPELKESEDEIMWKLIKKYAHCNISDMVLKADHITREQLESWIEKQSHDGKKWIYEDVYLKEKEQLIQDGIDEVLENPQKYGLVKQGEQKPVITIPKFKIRDWVINRTDAIIMQIVNNKDFYESVEINGQRRTDTYNYIEWDFRLWTIEDAKPGDVLSDGTTIFIFKDSLSDGSVMSYCDYDTNSGESDAFCPLSVNLICSKISPATKEQRNLLFSKMHEAGYVWDAEKKEPKNIEQTNSTWSEEDERSIRDSIFYLKSAKKYFEKDNDILWNEKWFNLCIEWLESLYKRLQPQQQWNEEEDEKNFQMLQKIICDSDMTADWANKLSDWLKSLRPQWKPSDEQIMALRWVLNHIPYDFHKEEISELLEQLKKLK